MPTLPDALAEFHLLAFWSCRFQHAFASRAKRNPSLRDSGASPEGFAALFPAKANRCTVSERLRKDSSPVRRMPRPEGVRMRSRSGSGSSMLRLQTFGFGLGTPISLPIPTAIPNNNFHAGFTQSRQRVDWHAAARSATVHANQPDSPELGCRNVLSVDAKPIPGLGLLHRTHWGSRIGVGVAIGIESAHRSKQPARYQSLIPTSTPTKHLRTGKRLF